MSAVSNAMNDFALSLYKQAVHSNEKENIFFSPMSIYTALSMVYAGAKSSTAHQMKECMKTPYLQSDVMAHKWMSELWNTISSGDSQVTLELANKLWLQSEYKIKKDYKSILKQYYSVESDSVDFTEDVETIRTSINQWVETKTKNKIKDLIPSGSLNGLTRLVLVNAIYFNGDWLYPFMQDQTRKIDFHSTTSTSTKVDAMFQKKRLRYFESEVYNSKLLSLPYKGSSTSLVVLLPNENDGLRSVETKLFEDDNTNELFSNCLSKNNIEEVEVFLPKFKFESSLPLKDCLIKMGMVDLFSSSTSDLSGISDLNDLYLSDAFHKAFIDVNEKGTEAAAATAMMMNTLCFDMRQPTQFKVDHPFIFFIYDEDLKNILFMGKVVDPQKILCVVYFSFYL